MFLHAMQEFDNDLGAWSDQNLAFSSLFSVVDRVQSIIEDTCFDHVGVQERFSTRAKS